MYACCLCVDLHPGGNRQSKNNLGTRMFKFTHLNSVLVHIKCTSNMAVCYDYNVNDVTALRVYKVAGTFVETQRCEQGFNATLPHMKTKSRNRPDCDVIRCDNGWGEQPPEHSHRKCCERKQKSCSKLEHFFLKFVGYVVNC